MKESSSYPYYNPLMSCFVHLGLFMFCDPIVIEIIKANMIFFIFERENNLKMSYCIDLNEADNCKEHKKHDEEYNFDRIVPDKFKFTWRENPKLQEKDNFEKLILAEYKKPKSFDIIIKIDEQKFECQLLILKSYSKYFGSKSKDERVIELNSSKIDSISFSNIYKWMISSSKDVRRIGLVSLLIGAEYLQVTQLVERCWNLIQDINFFQEDQAYLLYMEAKALKYEQIQLLMMKQIKKIFLTIVSTIDFVQMDKDEVKKWLQLENIGINSEIEIFYAACRWLLHDWEKRKIHLTELMKEVRFGLIIPWRITYLRKKENNGKLMEIMKNEELKKALEDSLAYSVYRNTFESINIEKFIELIEQIGFKRLFERELIFDPFWQENYAKNSYSYEDFQNYLKVIKSDAIFHWTKTRLIN